MNRLIGILIFTSVMVPAEAQMLTLDSCRALALRNNKQLSISRVKKELAHNVKKSARTKYLPHVTAYGTYQFTSREISILNDDQKSALSNMGTNLMSNLSGSIPSADALKTQFTQIVQAAAASNPTIAQQIAQTGTAIGAIGDQLGQQLSGTISTQMGTAAQALNQAGQKIVDAFHTDTRNMFGGSIMLTQPVYMGGSIIALNRMADIGELMAANSEDAKNQATLYNLDQAYWTVVSLKHKKRLAESYLTLLQKLSSDVNKMIKEGVATRSEGLSVDVKENEAEMTVTQVNDGLTLSKMLLCQLCGLPMESTITLADEDKENVASPSITPTMNVEEAARNRPELKLLQNTVDMAKQNTNLIKAGNLPQVMLTGGYAISNPSLYNGFEKKFKGVWNIGVLVRVPLWNWGDITYKVRASRNAATIAELEREDVGEKIELQVNQSNFKVTEAYKKLALAQTNTKHAEENLRCANLGFHEGVIQSTTVMEAQTAWLQAQSQKIDAEIDVKMSEVNLQKAMGQLHE